MALSAYAGSITTPLTAISQAYTGFGFQPKALIAIKVIATGSSDTQTAAYRVGFGFSDGTNDNSIALNARSDRAADSDGRTVHSSASAFYSHGTFGTNPFEEGAVASFDADGITVNWTTVSGAARRAYVLALGGADLTNVKVGEFTAATSTGDQAVTGIGFKPDLVLFISAGTTDASGVQTVGGAHFMLGAAGGGNQWVSASQAVDGTTPTDTATHWDSGACLALFGHNSSTLDGEATLQSMDADGFTVNWSNAPTNADRIGYLALKGGDLAVADTTFPTSDGTPQVVGLTASSGTIRGLLACSPVTTTDGSTVAGSRQSVGVGTPSFDGCFSIADLDNADPSDGHEFSSEELLDVVDTDMASDGDLTFTSQASGSATLTSTGTAGTAYKVGLVGFSDNRPASSGQTLARHAPHAGVTQWDGSSSTPSIGP